MLKYTLVPTPFFNREDSYKLLSQAVQLDEKDMAKYTELPGYEAVLVYAVSDMSDPAPAVAALLSLSSSLSDYNKVVVSLDDDYVHIVIAAGKKLLLCNSYRSNDYVTSEYYIFAAMKKFQINPEITTLYFDKCVPDDMRDDLFRYFQGVEVLCE
ncbi:MAG: DUF3822 family protein [Bacteroidales bacterium]